MNDLVARLSQGRHPVEVSLRPESSISELKACLDRGYVHIRFTGTRGGTELGVPIDWTATDVSAADFVDEKGQLTVAGELTLDYVRVRCVAKIALPSLSGEGWLEPIAERAGSAGD